MNGFIGFYYFAWTPEKIKKLIEYTKTLQYMDGTKPQHEFTADEIMEMFQKL